MIISYDLSRVSFPKKVLLIENQSSGADWILTVLLLCVIVCDRGILVAVNDPVEGGELVSS